MNEASKLPAADILDAEPQLDAEPDLRSRVGLYFAVGLGRGRGDRAADRHHARVLGRQLGAFRLAGRQPGDARLWLGERGDDRRQGLVRPPLARSGDRFAWRYSGRSRSAPISLCQHLGFNAIFLVSDPAQKWKLLQIFLAELTPFLAGAFFLGCVFLRSNRTFGRVYFADLAGAGLCGLVFLLAMYVFTPANLIAAPLALWLAACVAWAFGPGGRVTLDSICRRRRGRVRRPFRCAADVWPEDAGRQRLQGRRLRAQIPGREEGLRERFAVRLPRGLFEFLSAFCAWPLRQRRLHPADDAGQRLSRPLYRQRRSDRHHARSDRQGDGVLPLPADGLPLRHQVGAEDLHHPVRRRHLDRGRAALRRQGRDGRRGQSGGPRGLPRRRDPQVHRRHPVQGARHRLRGPPLPRPHRRAVRRHRLSASPIRSACPILAASRSSRSSPTRRRRWRPTCARWLPAACCRSRSGTRRSRRSRY